MKKYLLHLYIALFTAMSFSLTSCGDDEDEPDGGGKTSSAFTVNGVPYGAGHIGSGFVNNWYNDYDGINGIGASLQADLYPTANDRFDYFPCLNISLDIPPSFKLAKGAQLKISGGWIEHMSSMSKGIKYRYDDIVAGNITVSAVSSTSVSFNFNNLKLTNEEGSIILKGNLTCDYQRLTTN